MNPIDIIHSLKDRKIIILILLTIQVSFLVRAMEPSLDQYQDGIAVIDAQEHVNDQEEQLPATLWLPSDDSHADLLELNRFVRRNLNADVEQEGVLNVNMDALECLATLGRAPLSAACPVAKTAYTTLQSGETLKTFDGSMASFQQRLKKFFFAWA